MSAQKTQAPIVAHPQQPVDIAGIERELAKLWKPPDATGKPHETLTRACMSNLLIFCSSQEQACTIPEEIDEIVRIHPCRVILLVGEREVAKDDIDAYVSAHCHLSGDHGQICSEHITVNATGDAVRRLPSTARSLLLGDLPTSLWWASHTAPPMGGEIFEELAEMADQVVYSSLSWKDPAVATAETARWALDRRHGRATASDLAWRRLQPWRSLIAQSLDPATVPGALDSLTEVTIEHGAQSLPQAWLIAGWLASRLGWTVSAKPHHGKKGDNWRFLCPKGTVEVKVRPTEGSDPEVHRILIAWKAGKDTTTVSFATGAPGRLEVSHLEGPTQPRTLVAPLQSRASLVGKELQELERDDVFLEALRVAMTMADLQRS